MTTKKQAAANRENAAKSTGPKTAAGKAKSAQNATKHGILSDVVVAGHEDADLFGSLKDGLMREYEPQSSVEYVLVERLALLFWRERRLAHAEAVEADAVRQNAEFELKPQRDFVVVPKPHHFRGEQGVLPIETKMLMGRYQTMLSNPIEQTLASLRKEIELRESTIEAANENCG